MPNTLALGTVLLVVVALGLAIGFPAGGNGSTTSTSTPSTTASSTTTTNQTTTSTQRSSSTSSSSTSTQTVTVSSSTTTATSTTTSTSFAKNTTTSFAKTAFTDSVDGLQLRLSINATQLSDEGPDSALAVNVTEFNTLDASNNVTRSNDWPVQAALSSCPNTNVQPFGVAVYQGYYTAQNVSQGTQLQIFPITACPLYERLVTGYYFLPDSDLATVLPGSGVAAMSASLVVNGTYGVLPQSAPAPLNPYTTYTVVAADEWGTMVFLYFQVFPGPV